MRRESAQGEAEVHREAGCSKANRSNFVLFPLAAVSRCPGWEAANKEEEEILEVGRGRGRLGHQP